MKLIPRIGILILCFWSFNGFSQNFFYRAFGHVTEGAEGRNVAEAADGSYFLTYYTYYQSVFTACVTRVNCAGAIEWEKFFGNGPVTIPIDIIPQTDNGCVASFSVQDNSGAWIICIVRLDAAGSQVWARNLPIRASSTTGLMTQHTDSTLFICGSDTVAPNGIRGTTVIHLDSNGQLIWQKHYSDGQEHTPMGIAVSNSHVFVMGYAGFDVNPFTNMFVFSLNLSGDFIKRKVISTFYDDNPRSICTDNNGDVYITGWSYFLNSTWDGMFIRMNDQLQVLDAKFFDAGTPQGEWGWRIRLTPDNKIAVFGDEGGFNERNPMMIKFEKNGNVIWAKHYPVSPLFTNYIFDGWPCRDGGFLMTGDLRPASLHRIAPIMKTDTLGNMYCLTSAFQLTVRNETLGILDTSLNTFPVTDPIGSLPLAPGIQLTTSNNLFCHQLSPCGNFSFVIDSICPHMCFTFTDNSVNATSWQWSFPGGTPPADTSQTPPQVCYMQAGICPVTLTLSNQDGPTTFIQTVYAIPTCLFNIPNIFTPNGDGINDLFEFSGFYEPFELRIFNRWGNEVYHSEPPGAWWDGGNNPDGVYFFLLRSTQSDKAYKGTIQLQK